VPHPYRLAPSFGRRRLAEGDALKLSIGSFFNARPGAGCWVLGNTDELLHQEKFENAVVENSAVFWNRFYF
jgi:hypothetical protein